MHSIYIRICGFTQPQWGNVSPAPCPGKPKLRVSFAQKAVPRRHGDWCIRQPTKPYFEAYWSGDSAVFWSQFSFVQWQSLCSERWHFDSVGKISHGSHADASTKCIPICLSEMKWSMETGDYLQTISFYKVPCSIAILKTCRWQNIYDLIDAVIWGVQTMTWKIEAGTCKMLFLPGTWAHTHTHSWKQLIGLLKAFSFVKEICSEPLLYRQCRKHPEKYAGGETSWQLI